MPMPQNQTDRRGCLGSLHHLFRIRTGEKENGAGTAGADPAELEQDDLELLPYRLRDDFLSPAEKSFYHVLRAWAAEHRCSVFTKVSLADLFFVVRPNENKSAYNRINRKHVDFVICDAGSVEPLFAVELDDRSHQRPDRAERDAFVDDVFEAAGLPLLHVPARASYPTAEIAALFHSVLNGAEGVKAAEEEAGEAPT